MPKVRKGKKKQQREEVKWYDEDSGNWGDDNYRAKISELPMEGNSETHFCVNMTLPPLLLIAFFSSTIYLIYACCIPSIEDPPKRNKKKSVVTENPEKKGKGKTVKESKKTK